MKRFAHLVIATLPFFYFTYITNPGHVTPLHFSLTYPTVELCQEAAGEKEAKLNRTPLDSAANIYVGACKNSDSLDPEPTPTPASQY